jgi:hypothetical protein
MKASATACAIFERLGQAVEAYCQHCHELKAKQRLGARNDEARFSQDLLDLGGERRSFLKRNGVTRG